MKLPGPLTCLCLSLTWATGNAAFAQSGEELASAWCSTCHQYPAPELLDRVTWLEDVLPEMGARLGFESFRGMPRPKNPNAPEGVYPDEPLLEPDDWERIISFYEITAPEKLPVPEWPERQVTNLFRIEQPVIVPEADHYPAATAILIDEDRQNLLVGDSSAFELNVYDSGLNLIHTQRSGGAISRFATTPSGTYLISVMGGTIGQPTDPEGLLIELSSSENPDQPFAVSRLARQLDRPVDFAFGDFNTDGATDYVTAGFGHYAGAVTLHLSGPGGEPDERVLLTDPGTTSVIAHGADLYVLMAQADERILHIREAASARPHIETLMRFPPSQGSSSLSLLDFNADGFTDLLYTAGDNADMSPVYKPAHGIYLFAGTADGRFTEKLFFPFDGTYGAVAEDFDGDGDPDIAAIAHFPRLDQPIDQTSFVYLENRGRDFTAHFVEGIGELGRYVAITAGDLDGDGDKDIALANLAYNAVGPMQIPAALQEGWLTGPPFVLLRNLSYR